MDLLRERLSRHVEMLAELIGERSIRRPSAVEAARAYLHRELTEMGHVVETYPYAAHGRGAANLEVSLAGRHPSKPTLVIGAHYDTAPGTPGADDNASAVAMLLEIARSVIGRTTARPVRFVCYDCEEPPHFATSDMGSAHHAAQCRSRGERLMGMVCLESLGYFVETVDPALFRPGYLRVIDALMGGRYVAVVSDFASIRFGLRFTWTFLTSGRFRFVPAAVPQTLGAVSLSDHRSYWELRYPALMVTNTAFLRNPNYHRPSDRLATLDLARMEQLCRQLTRTVHRLARVR